ncbi:MAG: ATP-binding protein [Propionibacteriaceae bacterium]|jgi:hypothetical protein|nr:ATP-binding protein [Propionibacteriaceae bacterium]
MTDTSSSKTVNIAPGVSMLSVLQSLNYKPWFALAEFVDNAIQSSMADRSLLQQVDGLGYALEVKIRIDGDQITIVDNAGGIRREDFDRAFKPAAIPPDTTGLSEFGMGMKSAACWFSPKWKVATTSPNAHNTYVVSFDIDEIVSQQVQEIAIKEEHRPNPRAHFTRVELLDVRKMPRGRTLGKIKDHLQDIYRVLLRSGELMLELNGESLHYAEPAVMQAAYYRDPGGPTVEWRKDINLDLGEGRRVTGFAALRETGSTSQAGFSLFRRKRVIQGSGDETYRPAEIFGHSNDYAYQRLFGELHLHGFDVSHTKDAFQWGDVEDRFLGELRRALNEPPLPLISQAGGFRKRETSSQQRKTTEQAIDRTSSTLEQNLPGAVPLVVSSDADPSPVSNSDTEEVIRRELSILVEGHRWDVALEVVPDETNLNRWYDKQALTHADQSTSLLIRLNSAHPFVVRFGQKDSESLEAILRMAVAAVIGEYLASQGGLTTAQVVTRRISDVLTFALSRE